MTEEKEDKNYNINHLLNNDTKDKKNNLDVDFNNSCLEHTTINKDLSMRNLIVSNNDESYVENRQDSVILQENSEQF